MDIITNLTNCINEKTPVSFSKYGDGEFYCASACTGGNCDGDTYTNKLKNGLTDSFKYMTQEVENSYIGMWWDPIKNEFWKGLF
jgi:hypothetical protein